MSSKEPPSERPTRLVYLGTPEIAVAPLRSLVDAGFAVSMVVTGPDKRRGRRSEPSPTPVKEAALELGLTVTDRLQDAVEVGADLGVVVAFGRIIPLAILAELPMVNLHFSLLPRWRGAAPVERAILAGDSTTGVCLMRVTEGLDEGPVYSRAEIPVAPDSTADDLRSKLVQLGCELLVEALQAGLRDATEQSGETTYASKLSNEDLHVDWSRSASEVDRQVRVGGAWTTVDGARLKIWRAHAHPGGSEHGGPGTVSLEPGSEGSPQTGRVACGSGSVDLLEVQPEGRSRMAATDWLRGLRTDGVARLGT